MKLQLLHLYTAPAEAQQEKEQFSAAPVITNTHFIDENEKKSVLRIHYVLIQILDPHKKLDPDPGHEDLLMIY